MSPWQHGGPKHVPHPPFRLAICFSGRVLKGCGHDGDVGSSFQTLPSFVEGGCAAKADRPTMAWLVAKHGPVSNDACE